MCFRYTVPTIHSNDTIHTIHTIPTLHSKHSIPIIVTIHTIQTIHTVISNIPYPTGLHTIPTIHTESHPHHTTRGEGDSTTHPPHHRGEGDSTTPPPHHRGGGGQYYGWPMTMAGGERGVGTLDHIYTYIYFSIFHITGSGLVIETHVVVSYRVAAWALLTRHGRHIKEAIDEQPPPAAAS